MADLWQNIFLGLEELKKKKKKLENYFGLKNHALHMCLLLEEFPWKHCQLHNNRIHALLQY